MTYYHPMPKSYEAHYSLLVRKYGNTRLGRFFARRDAKAACR